MDLGLHNPFAATDLFAGFCGFFRGVYGKALGYGQAVFSEQLLTLILVEIHACLPSSFRYCAFGAAFVVPRHL
ncbi:hypothetical protein D3C77_732550 [compost metagenome]